MSLIDYAKDELNRAGLFDKDSDYDGMIAEAVMELITVLSKQGHSGGSHYVTMEVFNRVANYKPLKPLTNNPDEWRKCLSEHVSKGTRLWQSRRNSEIFSTDGGKTAYKWCDCDSKKHCMKCNNIGQIPQALKNHE